MCGLFEIGVCCKGMIFVLSRVVVRFLFVCVWMVLLLIRMVMLVCWFLLVVSMDLNMELFCFEGGNGGWFGCILDLVC